MRDDTITPFDITQEPEEVHTHKFHQHDLDGMTGPGVEKPSIPEINKAAQKYVTIRDNRISLTAKEVDAKDKLIGLLHQHEEQLGRAADGAIRYEFDDQLVELAPTKEKLRVRSLTDEQEE